MIVRPLEKADLKVVLEIFQLGIETGIATFELHVPDPEGFDSRFNIPCKFVCELDGLVRGWVALAPVSSRKAYAGVAELSIYVHPAFQRMGIGKLLLMRLIEESESFGFWTLTSTVFPQNQATLHLHYGCGFRLVGRRERIGVLNGIWQDTFILERRSEVVGI
ncbi:MAG: N-acetyltransferase [Flavobacteriales bacterium]|nr:N-acetyltransferase [Flavobacteriales bacterium]